MRNTPQKTNDSAGTDAKKKKIITALVILVCAIPVMYLATFLLDRDWNEVVHSATVNEVVQNKNIRFADIDWDEDITEDAVYMDKNRYISYTEGAVTRLITENHAAYGAGPEFFSRYFSAVISGDCDTVNLMYTDEYKKDNELHDSFTQQKVYNIEIEKLSENVIEDGKYAGIKRYTFRVAYMIKDNNGTFRDDMGSDAAVPLIFELLDSGYGPLINSITKYTYAY
nr:hypothetical protein [Clostridia bacterium]